jgi:hypothetical protein
MMESTRAMDDPKLIDLPPHKWKSDRKKPREPIFGSGAPEGLAYIASWIATAALIYWLRS